MNALTIIETSDNRLYRVTETMDPALAHVWYGTEVKRIANRFLDKKNARCELVRKAASRIITNAGEG